MSACSVIIVPCFFKGCEYIFNSIEYIPVGVAHALELISVILLLHFFLFIAVLQQFVDLLFLVINVCLKLPDVVFYVFDLDLNLCWALLRLESLPHTISYWTFVQSLIRLNSHFYLVTNTNKQKASLSAVDGHLPYNFIETLRVQLFSNRTNACLACLAFL